MTDRIAITAQEVVSDGSAQTAVARFRTSGADAAPTNVYWRLDDPDSGEQLQDWTSVTTGTSVNLVTTSDHNTARRCENTERRMIVVAANYGLSGQFISSFTYSIANIPGIRYGS